MRRTRARGLQDRQIAASDRGGRAQTPYPGKMGRNLLVRAVDQSGPAIAAIVCRRGVKTQLARLPSWYDVWHFVPNIHPASLEDPNANVHACLVQGPPVDTRDRGAAVHHLRA